MSIDLRFSPRNTTDIDDYTLDLSGFLNAGETVTLFSGVTIAPADTLICTRTAFTATSLTAVLSGGVTGTDYTVAYSFLTSSGRSITRRVNLFVSIV